jgi:hypothetical protein
VCEGVTPTAAYRNYCDWCEQEGKKPGKQGHSQTAFGRGLKAAGVVDGMYARERRYGLKLARLGQDDLDLGGPEIE